MRNELKHIRLLFKFPRKKKKKIKKALLRFKSGKFAVVHYN